MKIYPNELAWKEKLAKIPKSRQQHELNQLAKFIEEGFGDRFGDIRNGQDSDGATYIEFTPKPNAKMTDVQSLAEHLDAAAITADERDSKLLLGRTPAGLGLHEALRMTGEEGAQELGLYRVSPEELVEAVDNLHRVAHATTGELDAEETAAIEHRLVETGFLEAADVEQHNTWLSRDKEPEPGADPLGGELLGDSWEERDGDDW